MSEGSGTLSVEDRRRATQELVRRTLGERTSGVIVVSDATHSMVPLLTGGQALHWRRPAGRPRRGDLVIFASPTGLVVHRLMGRAAGGALRTKGDNRPALDADAAPVGAVIGVVEAIECADRVRRLVGFRPRAYALAALVWSAIGAAVHGVAEALDGAALRLVPRLGDRRLVRAPVWWVQRGGQRLLYIALFRVCHPVLERE